MSDTILTRDEIRHLDGYIDAALCETIDLPVPFGLRIATDSLTDSHLALLDREQVLVDALRNIEEVYADWLEAGDSSTAMDDLIAVNDIAVAALGDRSEYAVATPQGLEVSDVQP